MMFVGMASLREMPVVRWHLIMVVVLLSSCSVNAALGRDLPSWHPRSTKIRRGEPIRRGEQTVFADAGENRRAAREPTATRTDPSGAALPALTAVASVPSVPAVLIVRSPLFEPKQCVWQTYEILDVVNQ